MPAPDHLHAGHPVRQGWDAARARIARGGPPARPATRHVARWLDLRLHAWVRGQFLDTLQVTPRLLARIEAQRCPVTREALLAGTGPQAATVVLLREEAGFVAGNLVMMSVLAARTLAGDPTASLTPEAAQRAQDLRAFVTPMLHEQARARPLALLPPPRVRVLNPVHALQVLLTTLFSGGSYARRMTALGTAIPDALARRHYAALMSTLLARRLESDWAVGGESLQHALQDAWRHPMVQRRWADFTGCLTAAQCEHIVQRAVGRGLAAGRLRWLEPHRAVEGWAQPQVPRTSIAAPRATGPLPGHPLQTYNAQS